MKAIAQSKKLLCAALLTAMLGSVAMAGCGKAEEETNEAKNEVREKVNKD